MSTPRAALIAALVMGSAACAGSTAPARPGLRVESLGPDLQLLRVTDEVWIHVSEDETDRWGTIPANGMLLIGDGYSVLVDTGYRPDQAQRIVEFAEETLEAPVRAAIVTHGHADRIGGVEVLTSSVVVYAQEMTASRIAKLAPSVRLRRYNQEMTFNVGRVRVELYHPGAGHARDNIVVWLPDAKILFAGCILKSGRSADLGNREDAVLADWPGSVLRMLTRYSEAELVIPGHGPPGRIELLHHTLGLLEQEMSSTTLQ